MAERNPFFVDRTNAAPRPMNFWAPLVVSGATLEAEAARLAGLNLPHGSRRRSLIVHPSATEPGLGFAPGIEVSINLLMPGESTIRCRQNSSQVAMCVSGTGAALVGRQTLPFEQFDVWNVPSMDLYRYEGRGREPAVFLSYSNAPLLEKLGCITLRKIPQSRPTLPRPNRRASARKISPTISRSAATARACSATSI